MVVIKSSRELQKMKDACRISANALVVAGKAVEPGVSTLEIDTIVRKYIEKEGATPSFLGYGGFPASAQPMLTRFFMPPESSPAFIRHI